MAEDSSRIVAERGSLLQRWMLSCAAALALLPSSRPLLAQPGPTEAQAAHPPVLPTLHVYENLMQLPVLVLNRRYERMKPLDPTRFRLSLDSGPLFRPAYVRQEGDDPISLAILIDASNPESDLLPQLSSAIAALVPDYLQPRDHVSIYAISCGLIRTAYDAPANAATLKASVEDALFSWRVRREQKVPQPLCKSTLPLWDSMANVLNQFDRQRVRRVLLAITDGHDSGSRTPWTYILHQAQVQSIAVFGLLTMPVIGTEWRSDTGEISIVAKPFIRSPEDKLNQICELSGGVEMQARSAILSLRLKEFTRTVRERYILEFSRSRDQRAGVHSLQVSYSKRNNFYLVSSGIAVPVASDDEIRGAHTLPADPSKSPVEGDRRILVPPID